MYQIVVCGEVVALCDKPRFIKVNKKTGAYIEATEQEAQGVAARTSVYNLPGHSEIKIVRLVDEQSGTTETVTAPEADIRQVDGGIVTFENLAHIEGNKVKISEVDETALTGLMATTDLYEELIAKGVLD